MQQWLDLLPAASGLLSRRRTLQSQYRDRQAP
jgi:hypothetical protein